jgi:heme exporter protein C
VPRERSERDNSNKMPVATTRWPHIAMLLGAALLALGAYWGLFVAPPEQYMGDVYRILYIHVPTAWNAMLAFLFAFVCAAFYLMNGAMRWDARLEAAMEVGVVLSLLLCAQGSLWAKPTWGVWWDWDPRLTTTAIMVMAFAGVLALRRFVDDPVRRATWSAVSAIVASANVPIVYFSVRWWNSLHQQPSSAGSVSGIFHRPLLVNFLGMLLLAVALIAIRTRVAALRLDAELAPPPGAAGGAR